MIARLIARERTVGSTVMAARKHTFHVKEKSILTSKAVFANHLPRIGVLIWNSDGTGCVRGGGRSVPSFNLFFLNIYGFF